MIATVDAAGSPHGLAITPAPLDALTLLAELTGTVEDLQNARALNRGQANSLLGMIDEVGALLEKGKDKVALNKLGAFRQHVDGLVNGGVLSKARGQELATTAERLEQIIEAG